MLEIIPLIGVLLIGLMALAVIVLLGAAILAHWER